MPAGCKGGGCGGVLQARGRWGCRAGLTWVQGRLVPGPWRVRRLSRAPRPRANPPTHVCRAPPAPLVTRRGCRRRASAARTRASLPPAPPLCRWPASTPTLCAPLDAAQVRVTREHNEECKRLLRLMGVPVIEASGRAGAWVAGQERSAAAGRGGMAACSCSRPRARCCRRRRGLRAPASRPAHRMRTCRPRCERPPACPLRPRPARRRRARRRRSARSCARRTWCALSRIPIELEWEGGLVRAAAPRKPGARAPARSACAGNSARLVWHCCGSLSASELFLLCRSSTASAPRAWTR